MKKIIAALGLLCGTAAHAQEGMWLPQLLGQQKYAEMKAKGLKLTAEQLYSINKASAKDAVVLMGNGFSGAIVSNEGLVFTSYDCAVSAVTKAANTEHDYVKDGFFAKSKTEEIPVKDLWARQLVKIDDISKQVADSMAAYPNWTDWRRNRDSVFLRIGRAATAGSGYEGRVYSSFNDNQFLLYSFVQYKDVRLAGIPPQSIGRFGGKTDFAEWPRHTADFSVLRIYTGADGKPAAYAAGNLPLKVATYLPISLKGVKENDLTVLMGYPMDSYRLETSYGIKQVTELQNPANLSMVNIRLNAMDAAIQKDPAARQLLSTVYNANANYKKQLEGETMLLLKTGLYGKKKAGEDAFTTWAKPKTEYASLWTDYDRAYATWKPFAKSKSYYEQGIMAPLLVKFAIKLLVLNDMLTRGKTPANTLKEKIKELDRDRAALVQEIYKPAEMKVMAEATKAFHTDIENDLQPVAFYTELKYKWGGLKDDETYQNMAGSIYSNTIILDDAKWKFFIAQPDAGTLAGDPAFNYAFAFYSNWISKIKPKYQYFTDAISDLGHRYVKGSMEMNPKKVFYPDANGGMRVGFGTVKGYKPNENITLNYVCTMKGLLDKYKPGDPEFDLPAAYADLYNKKDFGQYADLKSKDIIVSFITTADNAGGQKGAAVLNADGQLTGLAFDQNHEALGSNYYYDAALNRSVVLDIRYLLWCIEKPGGAGNLIKELKLVK